VGIFTLPIGKGLQDPSTLAILNQFAVDSGGIMFADPAAPLRPLCRRIGFDA